VPFPRLPKVSAADWRRLSLRDPVVGPITELDPLRSSFQWQVMRVLFPIYVKALLAGSFDREATRERNRERILDELDRKLRERPEQTAGANGVTTPAA
jgi:hypothetical protein